MKITKEILKISFAFITFAVLFGIVIKEWSLLFLCIFISIHLIFVSLMIDILRGEE